MNLDPILYHTQKINSRSSVDSVQFSLSVVSDSLRPRESQHARPPCPSPTPGVHSDSCPSSPWCHPAISSCVIPFSSCPQSLPASKSFPMSQLFTWGGQSTGVSASASFLPKKSQGWSSEWTGCISLQSKELSRVFSNTTVQKHQIFGAQPSSLFLNHSPYSYFQTFWWLLLVFKMYSKLLSLIFKADLASTCHSNSVSPCYSWYSLTLS